jgi:sporulation protein YlmC with PRC-barrel domain
MRFFANDVQDKYVMSNDGKYLGTVDNLVVDTKSGKVLHILVIPSEEVDIRKFRMDLIRLSPLRTSLLCPPWTEYL